MATSKESAAAAVRLASIVPLLPNSSPDRIRGVRPPHDLGEIDNLAALLLHKVATEEPTVTSPIRTQSTSGLPMSTIGLPAG